MMNGITVLVISMVMMFLVSRMLKENTYIEKIVKATALILTAISGIAIVNSSFYKIFNLCERLAGANAAFAFIGGVIAGAVVLFLAYCWIGQTAADCEITF